MGAIEPGSSFHSRAHSLLFSVARTSSAQGGDGDGGEEGDYEDDFCGVGLEEVGAGGVVEGDGVEAVHVGEGDVELLGYAVGADGDFGVVGVGDEEFCAVDVDVDDVFGDEFGGGHVGVEEVGADCEHAVEVELVFAGFGVFWDTAQGPGDGGMFGVQQQNVEIIGEYFGPIRGESGIEEFHVGSEYIRGAGFVV